MCVIPSGTGQTWLLLERQKEVHIYNSCLISHNPIFSFLASHLLNPYSTLHHPTQHIKAPPDRQGRWSYTPPACPPRDKSLACDNPSQKNSRKVSTQKWDIAQNPQIRALRFVFFFFFLAQADTFSQGWGFLYSLPLTKGDGSCLYVNRTVGREQPPLG